MFKTFAFVICYLYLQSYLKYNTISLDAPFRYKTLIDIKLLLECINCSHLLKPFKALFERPLRLLYVSDVKAEISLMFTFHKEDSP